MIIKDKNKISNSSKIKISNNSKNNKLIGSHLGQINRKENIKKIKDIEFVNEDVNDDDIDDLNDIEIDNNKTKCNKIDNISIIINATNNIDDKENINKIKDNEKDNIKENEEETNDIDDIDIDNIKTKNN